MRRSLALRSLLALTGAGAAELVLAGPAAAVEPRAGGNANCVAQFTSALGPLGVAGEVISGGAHDLQPFGQNVVTVQAQSPRGDCAFDPNDFLPAAGDGQAPASPGRPEP
jgi:hypothetical protein